MIGRGTHDIIVIIVGSGFGHQSSNRWQGISLSANTLEEGMNPTILTPTVGEQ